jgi:hypothetical protein
MAPQHSVTFGADSNDGTATALTRSSKQNIGAHIVGQDLG